LVVILFILSIILSPFSFFYTYFLLTYFSEKSYVFCSFITVRKFRLDYDISSFLAAAAADFYSTRASLSSLTAADFVDLTEVVELILPLLVADDFPGSAANFGTSNLDLKSEVDGANAS
jgi:hypothetical protein